MKMFAVFAKYKDKDVPWKMVTNYGQQFLAEEGIVDYMIEKMVEKYPTIEYKKEKVN